MSMGKQRRDEQAVRCGGARRSWRGQSEEETVEKLAARAALYGDRRRIRGERFQRLLRNRGEWVERSFTPCYDTGGMRRTHLKKHGNILKRLQIHTAGFNLSLILRRLIGLGTARGLQGLAAHFADLIWMLCRALRGEPGRRRPVPADLPYTPSIARCAT